MRLPLTLPNCTEAGPSVFQMEIFWDQLNEQGLTLTVPLKKPLFGLRVALSYGSILSACVLRSTDFRVLLF